MDEHFGRKHTTAFIIAIPVFCCCGANFKLPVMVIKNAEETINCKAEWKFCYIKNVQGRTK
jgi:hypothetical protein